MTPSSHNADFLLARGIVSMPAHQMDFSLTLDMCSNYFSVVQVEFSD